MDEYRIRITRQARDHLREMLPIELHNCRIGCFLGLPRGLLGGSGTTGCGRNTDERSSDCE